MRECAFGWSSKRGFRTPSSKLESTEGVHGGITTDVSRECKANIATVTHGGFKEHLGIRALKNPGLGTWAPIL